MTKIDIISGFLGAGKTTFMKKMIEEYDKILSLTETEREYMALCLTYPEKFWKVANSYYRSRKSWISEKTLEKLEIAIRQIEEKKQFVKTVFSFQAD